MYGLEGASVDIAINLVKAAEDVDWGLHLLGILCRRILQLLEGTLPANVGADACNELLARSSVKRYAVKASKCKPCGDLALNGSGPIAIQVLRDLSAGC
jgi:hypothetical protein